MEIFIDKKVMVIGVGFTGVYPAKKLSITFINLTYMIYPNQNESLQDRKKVKMILIEHQVHSVDTQNNFLCFVNLVRIKIENA